MAGLSEDARIEAEFDNAQVLTLSEAHMLCEAHIDSQRVRFALAAAVARPW
jgi:hypothetical protein